MTVILLSLLFIVLTSPGAFISQYYDVLIISYTGKIILFSGDCISFSFHALSIIILSLTNKRFLNKLKTLFIINQKRSNKVTSLIRTNPTQT